MAVNHKHDPSIDRTNRKYELLGIHGDKVLTVEGNVARVRMYIGNEQVDEDFALPKTITVKQQLDTLIQSRMAEITQQRTADGVNEAEGS